jgi:glutamyl-tRNA synthetase
MEIGQFRLNYVLFAASMENRVRVRFAPSPTGFLHIGGLRSALYNELFARNKSGDFILRIEDTDQSRFIEGAVENLCRSLKACQVVPNEGVWIDDSGKIIERGEKGPYIQSKRKETHQAYAQQLIAAGHAYECFCTPERLEEMRKEQQLMKKPTIYDGKCRNLSRDEVSSRVANGETFVVRLKLPRDGKISFNDVIRGTIEFEWALIDDQVIIKSDGFPTYHLAAMCDDHDMEITHVIRGEEWLSSTPKHLFIYQCFGWKIPEFAHLPLLLNPDRSKLSKRQGDVAVEDYLQKGYLPEALINFVALLGWNPTSDREIYSHEELIQLFDLSKVNKAGAVFNTEKLDWMNHEYLLAMPSEKYLELTRSLVQIADAELRDRCLLLVRDRVHKLSEIKEQVDPLIQEPNYDTVSLTWKTQAKADAKERLEGAKNYLENISDEVFSSPDAKQQLEAGLKQLIADRGWGNGELLWPLRVALSGQEKSPSPFELLELYRKQKSLERIQKAIEWLG